MAELKASSHAERTIKLYERETQLFRAWCLKNGYDEVLDQTVAEYLVDLYEQGYAPATIGSALTGIRFNSASQLIDSPIGIESRKVMKGIRRKGAMRGRGQSEALSRQDYMKIMATACDRRSSSSGFESENTARERGMLDRVIVSLLWMGLMRRNEVSKVTWGDVYDPKNGDLIFIQVPISKTNQFGEQQDIRTLKGIGAEALLDLRRARCYEPSEERIVRLTPSSVNIRFKNCCKAIGLSGNYTSHSGRIGMASTLCGAGAPVQAVAIAGGWKSAQMVIHYSRRVELENGAIAKYL